MDGKFACNMVKAYLSGTFGDMLAQILDRGLSTPKTPYSPVNSLLSGMQVGTAFIGYPLAVETLTAASKKFREQREKGNKLVVYTAGGVTAAAMMAVINYPIVYAQNLYNGKKEKPCPVNMFVGGIAPTIGFTAGADFAGEYLPKAKCKGTELVRHHAINFAGNVGASVLSTAVEVARHGKSGLAGLYGPIAGLRYSIIQDECAGHIGRLL